MRDLDGELCGINCEENWLCYNDATLYLISLQHKGQELTYFVKWSIGQNFNLQTSYGVSIVGTLEKFTTLYLLRTFFVLCVLLHNVEKIPSVQSLVATSSRPNIWGAVIALGFILISRWGAPHSVMDFISTLIHLVLPAPDGPRAIMPWRTFCVSYNWTSLSTQGAWCTSCTSCTYNQRNDH